MLSTLTLPTDGTAKILGYDVVKKPIEVRKRISSVIQATAVELFLSVKDNLLTYARFQGLDKATAARRADALIVEFQLGPEVDRKVQDLSGGFRRRVQVAKVFMVDTPVLFLDEFSTGMDPILKRQVMNLLRAKSRKEEPSSSLRKSSAKPKTFATTSSSSTGENRSRAATSTR